MHYYGLELQHLNPNEIQHISAFVALCEGYLGIEPHFELWKYFFTIELQKKKKRPDLVLSMGCASIRLQGSRASEYMSIPLLKSNKGWHKLWFYLRNDAAATPTDLHQLPSREGTGRVEIRAHQEGAEDAW